MKCIHQKEHSLVLFNRWIAGEPLEITEPEKKFDEAIVRGDLLRIGILAKEFPVDRQKFIDAVLEDLEKTKCRSFNEAIRQRWHLAFPRIFGESSDVSEKRMLYGLCRESDFPEYTEVLLELDTATSMINFRQVWEKFPKLLLNDRIYIDDDLVSRLLDAELWTAIAEINRY